MKFLSIVAISCILFRKIKGFQKRILSPLFHSSFSSISNHQYSRKLSMQISSGDVLKWVNSFDKDSKNLLIIQDGKCCAANMIKKGDILLSIPQGLVLDINKAATKLSSQISASQLKTGDLGLLALFLIVEKNAKKDSKWAPYIQELPTIAPGILSWSSEELDELYVSTTRDIAAQVQSIQYDYDTISGLRIPMLSNILFTLQEFQWAMGIIKSRVFYIENKPCLIPGIDSLSFDPFSTSEPFLTTAGIFGGKVIKILADKTYNRNEEIQISYGLKSSAECLEDHGIIPLLDMADTCAEITIVFDESSDKFYDDKLNVLENNGYPTTRMRFDLEPEIDIDPILLQYLRLKFIEGKDAFILEACFSDTVWSTLSLPFSKPNELKVYLYLNEICEKLLNKLNTKSNEEQDKAMLLNQNIEDASLPISTRRKLLLAELRQQERFALKGVLNSINMEVKLLEGSGLDTREYYQERRLRDLNLLRPLEESEIVMLPGEQ